MLDDYQRYKDYERQAEESQKRTPEIRMGVTMVEK